MLVTASDVDDENNVLWVSDFDFNDFEHFLDKAGVLSLPRETLRRDFFDEVGARPADIYKTTIQARRTLRYKGPYGAPDNCGTDADRQSAKFQAERAVFDKFMNDAQRRAFDDVDNLLTQADSKHDFRRLLVALCRNPAGVAQSEVHFDAKRATKHLKGFRAIHFNPEANLFQFYSKAHENAARHYFNKRGLLRSTLL